LWSVTHIPELDEYGERIAALEYEPLKVTVTTDSPVSCNDPISLDGVLAYAMVTDALKGRPFPQGKGPYWQPLPLHCAKMIEGLPLWSSTDFVPTNLHKRMTHIHRRTADNPYAMIGLMRSAYDKRPRRFPSSSAGPYMDYRVPERRYFAESWSALCLGNLEEVRRLLTLVATFGKGGKRGSGYVRQWTVEPVADFSFYTHDGRALRPVPLGATETAWAGVRQGWTPPYWLKETWLLCQPSDVASIL